MLHVDHGLFDHSPKIQDTSSQPYSKSSNPGQAALALARLPGLPGHPDLGQMLSQAPGTRPGSHVHPEVISPVISRVIAIKNESAFTLLGGRDNML
jgi:hypothetical protein